ncbi:hypothetical protein AAMO2058_001157800 [Amorphochlora amoebiformis]
MAAQTPVYRGFATGSELRLKLLKAIDQKVDLLGSPCDDVIAGYTSKKDGEGIKIWSEGQQKKKFARDLMLGANNVILMCFDINDSKSLKSLEENWVGRICYDQKCKNSVIFVGLQETKKETGSSVLDDAKSLAERVECKNIVTCCLDNPDDIEALLKKTFEVARMIYNERREKEKSGQCRVS